MNNKPESKLTSGFIGRKQLGSILTCARQASNMTRDDVVEKSKTGFSRSSLQAWESGEREPKLDNLYDLASLYNVHPWELLSGEPLPQPQQVQPPAISVEDAIDTLKMMIEDTQTKLTEEEAFLLKEFRALDNEERRLMLRFIIGGFDSINSGSKKGIFQSPDAQVTNSFNE